MLRNIAAVALTFLAAEVGQHLPDPMSILCRRDNLVGAIKLIAARAASTLSTNQTLAPKES